MLKVAADETEGRELVKINGHELVALVRAGASFKKGVLVENQEAAA